MSRSPLFHQLKRLIRVAEYCEDRGISSREGLEALREERQRPQLSRRGFLGLAGAAAAAGVTGGLSGCVQDLGRLGSARGALNSSDAEIAIVGAGMAGLACADRLADAGITATVFEASDRVGGRVWSMGGSFGGSDLWGNQTFERGGEWIDTSHRIMRRYARQLDLTLEDVRDFPGPERFYFDGQQHTEEDVLEGFRDIIPRLRADRRLLGEPTADSFTPTDRQFDLISLRDYLDQIGAGSLIKQVIDVSYEIEFGSETEEQSCLNLLFYISLDRNEWKPFGSSDERFHIASGNQGVPVGLANRIPRPVRFGRKLTRVKKTPAGRFELTFESGQTPVFDYVVLTLPFTVLREVELHNNLGLPSWKRQVIDDLAYGTTSKLMVRFNGRPWHDLGSNGGSFSDLAHLQNTWETNPSGASSTSGILTDFTGGNLGASLNAAHTQSDASDFLADLNRVFPGSAARAKRKSNGDIIAHVEAWKRNPLAKGGYCAPQVGYFTTYAGNEGKRVGNVMFGGEHTDSFYNFQGFMEGAATSGISVAEELIDELT